MKRRFQPVPNDPQTPNPNSYAQDGVYWPVDRWDDELTRAQPLMDVADEYRILRMPLMGQAVKNDTGKSPGTLCGPTSASMVYNFWQLGKYPDDPEDHYIKMTHSGGWSLRDTAGQRIPFANLATVSRSANNIGYLDAHFGDPPSILTAKSEDWVQDKCKLIVDSIKFKCPVVLYSRFSVTSAHQHIITVSGYIKLAGELWFLILDPESLEIAKSNRLKMGMYSLAPLGALYSRENLKTLNASHNAICLLEGVYEEALGSIYFLKASHLFAPHCLDDTFLNYQNADAGTVGHYIHHGHKGSSISVPDELVVSSGSPKVTVPVPTWSLKDIPALVGSLVSSFPFGAADSLHRPPSSSPAPKPTGQGISFAQLLVEAQTRSTKIRDYIATRVHDSLSDVKASRMTLQPYNGYFPLGMQGSWHGGIHLACNGDSSIHCCADGVVVAARLPSKDPEKPVHGSRNFVLVRHETPDQQPYWSLYMHLRPNPYSESDTRMQLAMPWLFQLTLTKTEDGGTALRAGPDAQCALVRTVATGESFSVLDTQTVGNRIWYHVQSPQDSSRGWIAKTERVTCAMGVPELQPLQKGGVVALNRPIRFATCVGFADPGCRKGDVLYFHWEIFSKDPLPGNWQTVCDQETQDRQWLNDPDLVRQILNRNKMGSYLEPLTPERIVHTCGEPMDDNGKILRGCAVKFKSEWSIEWSTAADEAKLDPPVKDKVVKEFQPYSFWKDAVAAKVPDLPSDGKVWHYNPREALNRLHPIVAGPKEKSIPELAEALKTHWSDPHGIPYTQQNAQNIWIQMAAMNHGLSPIFFKALVAQESKFKPKAISGGHAGLTQLGLEEAHSHGLNTGETSVVDKVWVYDPADERFDAPKSLNAGAAYYAEGRDGAQLSVFQHFEGDVPEDQYDKFGLAIYNLGSGTVSRAHEFARQAGKTDATWEDLIEGGLDSFLCKGMPETWNPTIKYKEGTEYVSQILQRAAGG